MCITVLVRAHQLDGFEGQLICSHCNCVRVDQKFSQIGVWAMVSWSTLSHNGNQEALLRQSKQNVTEQRKFNLPGTRTWKRDRNLADPNRPVGPNCLIWVGSTRFSAKTTGSESREIGNEMQKAKRVAGRGGLMDTCEKNRKDPKSVGMNQSGGWRFWYCTWSNLREIEGNASDNRGRGGRGEKGSRWVDRIAHETSTDREMENHQICWWKGEDTDNGRVAGFPVMHSRILNCFSYFFCCCITIFFTFCVVFSLFPENFGT